MYIVISVYMKPLFDITKIWEISDKTVPLECELCHNSFNKETKQVKSDLKLNKNKCKFCGPECLAKSKVRSENVKCAECYKEFLMAPSSKRQSKSGNNFCSKSCAAKYNNTHKTKGTRRSKLEKWLEVQLTALYPSLEIEYNQKNAINSELDIYVPSLKVAFELNGIFHYEPIYGSEKLASIQNNDNRKFQACLESNIELVIIDVSTFKYFKGKGAAQYLNIITDIIQLKLSYSLL